MRYFLLESVIGEGMTLPGNCIKNPLIDNLGFGWGCATETLETLTYTSPSSAEFCFTLLALTPQIPHHSKVPKYTVNGIKKGKGLDPGVAFPANILRGASCVPCQVGKQRMTHPKECLQGRLTSGRSLLILNKRPWRDDINKLRATNKMRMTHSLIQTYNILA